LRFVVYLIAVDAIAYNIRAFALRNCVNFVNALKNAYMKSPARIQLF
jgi:hypothetical protein